MSAILMMALCLQVLAVTLMRHRLGQGWLRRPVTLLVLAAVLYSGVSEVILAIPSIRVWDKFRIGIDQQYIDSATLIMSVGLLALVICYLATRPERAAAAMSDNDVLIVTQTLDWRLMALACAPLAVLTYEGRGFSGSIRTGVQVDLAATYLAILVTLTAFAFLLRYGRRWFFLTLTCQSALLAAAGERTPLITGAIVLLVLLRQVGLRPARRQLGAALVLTILVILGVTGYRATSGRAIYGQNSGLKARIEVIGSGLYTLVHTSNINDTKPGLIAQAAARLDGNAFAGGVLQGIRFGHPTLGIGPAGESILILIPSTVWPSKLDHPVGLNPALTELNYFGMQRINFLPTFLGLYIGFLGEYYVILLLAALGVLFGWGERWLFRRFTVTRLVMLASAMEAALSYEKGLPGMLVVLRAAVVLAIITKLIELMRGQTARWMPGGPGIPWGRHDSAPQAVRVSLRNR